MKRQRARLGMILLAAGLAAGCITLKYELLKETSLANPPGAPSKIYIREFPVDSKAAVGDPRAADAAATQGGQQYVTNELASTAGAALTTISRPSRIEDLSGAVLRELRKDKVRVFSQLVYIDELNDETVREIDNPFVIVSMESAEAQLEIVGAALISSQRVRKVFSNQTKSVDVEVEVKDLRTGKVSKKSPSNVGVVMTFNSRELEEAMAIAVVTSLTRKLLF